ncbi:MAG: class I SAM-dependent methyltransferase [Pseudomonadota bacterium]
MRPDIRTLETFYASPRGHLATRLIRRRLKPFAPEVDGLRVLGLGYPRPFLEALGEGAERVLAFMPDEQGACRCPRRDGNVGAMVKETMLPLADRSMDIVLLAHALEATDRANRLLREIWRVLDDGGRLVAIVPNRRGLWCLAEATPFGHGRPYSSSQLHDLLRINLFRPLRSERALHVPPFTSSLWLRTAPMWERVGERLTGQFSGVILIEAEKTTVAATPVLAGANERSRRILAMPVRGAAARDQAEETPSVAALDASPPAARPIAFTSRRRRG